MMCITQGHWTLNEYTECKKMKQKKNSEQERKQL